MIDRTRGDHATHYTTDAVSGVTIIIKAVIKNADLSEDMQQDAVDFATQALEKYDSWREQVNFQ
jgi:hypothetical protein